MTRRVNVGFDAFVVARGPALWRSAWLLTGDRHKAEDLVQAALLKAWPKFEAADSFEAYVRRVMYTTYAGWWARRWRHEIPSPDELLEDGHAIDRPVDRDLILALAALPRGQRAVIVLRYFEDLTEVQTADALAISVGTVKSQTSRALIALRTSPALEDELW